MGCGFLCGQGIWRSPLILLGGNRLGVRYERGMCEVGDSKAFQCLFLSGGFGLSNIVGSVGFWLE